VRSGAVLVVYNVESVNIIPMKGCIGETKYACSVWSRVATHVSVTKKKESLVMVVSHGIVKSKLSLRSVVLRHVGRVVNRSSG